jgi:exo-beta-1,3-glucanase (GH17 family)
LCFSPYEEGQKPGDVLNADQIRRRLELIRPYTSWVRSFSCTEGNEQIPRIAKELGFKTLVGCWLGSDREKNAEEMEGLAQLCREGVVNIASIGNEVLYRGDLSEEDLLAYMEEARHFTGSIPIGYVDAYYEFVNRPQLVDASDVVLANCYPFWEKCHQDYSLIYMKEMYRQALGAARGKKVIITETGWPSQGSDLGAAHPSYENALKYFINAQQWSREDQIEMFYFSSFDESWKISAEGDVGAYWGLWDAQEQLKF